MEDPKKSSRLDEIFVPAELVERSAFLDKGSGIIDETLTPSQKIRAWFYNDFIGSISEMSLVAFAYPISFTVGLMLKLAAASDCREVPVGVTGLYSLDTSGYWSSNPLYNPSSAIYSISMNNFLKTNAEYRSSITDIRAKLKEVGQKINKIDFGLSLLYWMSWSTTVSNGSSSYKFQLSGDTRVIFDRTIQESYMSNVDTDCRVTSATAYNPFNGKFTISFPVDEYKLYCNGISTAEDLGYNNQSYSNTLDIKWDAVSHATATAINEKVITINDLVKLKNGPFGSSSVDIDGYFYKVNYFVDSRYPKMDFILCFEPDDVSTFSPSFSPIKSPVRDVYNTSVRANQIITGISLQNSSSLQGSAKLVLAITKAISDTSPLIMYKDIEIISIKSYLGSDDIIVGFDAFSHYSRESLSSSMNKTVTFGFLTSRLKEQGFSNAAATILPLLTENRNPTFSPTSSSPTFSPTSSSPTFSPSVRYRSYPKPTPKASTFCLIVVSGSFNAYPYLFHYGSSPQTRNQFKPEKCDCDSKTGHVEACDEFDLISGVVIFGATDSSVVKFANSVAITEGGISSLVYNASFASINHHNLNNSLDTIADTEDANSKRLSLNILGTPKFRKDAYGFCTFGCKGIVQVRSFGTYDTVVNGEHYEILRGSCNDSTYVSEAAWRQVYDHPPTSLVAGYLVCAFTLKSCIVAAVGSGASFANTIMPIAIFITIIFFTKISCFVQKKMIKDVYSKDERERALCHLATHLLMIRDQNIAKHCPVSLAEDIFIKNLFANSDMVQENQNPSSVSIPPSDNQLSNTDEGEQIESNKVDKAHETTV